MKIAIVSKVVYSPDFRTSSRTWEFIENGTSKHIVEVESLHNIVKSIMITDILNGTFGTKPHIYKWVNRPEKIVKGNTIIKKNYKVL